jgi:hypothetical protein
MREGRAVAAVRGANETRTGEYIGPPAPMWDGEPQIVLLKVEAERAPAAAQRLLQLIE